MTLVPLDVAARICGVKPGTIRRWVHDKRIIRHHYDGHGQYDVHELLLWIEARNPDALMVRAGLVGDHGARLGRSA